VKKEEGKFCFFPGRSFSRPGRFKNLKESNFGGFELPELRGKNK
jgi:hypothetical protein